MDTSKLESSGSFYAEKGLLDKAASHTALIRDLFVNADSGNWERAARLMSEDLVAYEPDCLPYGGIYKGIDGYKRLVDAMFSHWKKVDYNVKEICAGGDFVVVLLEVTFTTKSGRAFTMHNNEVWKFQDGKVVELRLHYYDPHYASEMCLEHAV